MAEIPPAPNHSDEQRDASPGAPPSDAAPTDVVGQRGHAPAYDTSKEGYAGISTGTLGHIDDVRAARDFAEMIVDTIRESLLILDLDLRVVAANESFYDTFDVDPAETVGRLVYDLGSGPWDVAELRELLEGILPHEKAFDDYEVRHDFENVGERVMLLNARRLDDHEMILLAIEDVTERTWAAVERVEAEKALRQSEKKYRTLFESMDQGYCVLEMIYGEDEQPVDYRFVEANPAFVEQTGLVDAVGRTALELVPDLERHWVEVYGRIAETGEPVRFQQGSEAMGRWFDVYASRVDAPGRGPGSRRVALLFTDITARKGTEEARRESERRYRALFRQAPAFIAALRGPEHVFDFVNPAYLRLVGERDLLGKPVREALPEVEGQGFLSLLDEVYEQGEPFSAMNRPVLLQREAGKAPQRRYVDFVYQPLREPDGAIAGVIAFGVDTTERVLAEEALARMNRELERRVDERTREVQEREAQVRELARALTLAEHEERRRIAHVLHDDLQQVLFGAQLADALGDTDRYKEVLAEALRLTRSLSHELSPPLLQDEDLEQLLVWLAQHEQERHGLEVDVEIRGDVRVPEADLRVLLYQLLRELLFNVAKHAGTQRARVVAERPDGYVHLVVEDEGAGFDPAELDEAGNVGLGLPSVRERLKLVGGELEVESAPGAGTRVTITVPVDENVTGE